MRHIQNTILTFPLLLLLLLSSCRAADKGYYDPAGPDPNHAYPLFERFFGTWEKQSVIDLTQDIVDLSSTQLYLGISWDFTLTQRTAGQEKLIHGAFSSHSVDSTSDTYFVFVVDTILAGTTSLAPADTIIQYYQCKDGLLFLPAPGTSGDTIRWKRI